MLGFCEMTRCRRQVLLAYFGEDLPEPCGNCDTCAGKVETRDGTIVAQKALSCVYRTGQLFGAGYLTDVLLGKDDERIRRFGHDKVSTFGIGKELSEREWKSVFRQLVAAGLISVDLEGKGGFRLAPRAWPVLRGEEKFELRKDPVAPKPERKPTIRPERERPGLPSAPMSGELWEKLRSLRLEIARNQGIAPFIIFHDSTLREMIRTLPRTIEEMGEISGIGERKLERYGEQFMALILDYLKEQPAPSFEKGPDAGDRAGPAALELHLEREPMHGSPEQQKAEIIRPIKEGKPSSNEIVGQVGVSRPTIWAYKAHVTMGTYGSDGESEAADPDENSLGIAHPLSTPDSAVEQIPYDKLPLAGFKELVDRLPPKRSDESFTDERIIDIRKKHPRAYEPWSDEEDRLLIKLYNEEPSIAALSKIFQRQPGAITARIRKLTGA